MAHFAKLDKDNNVIAVNVVNNAELNATNEEETGIKFLTNWSGGYSNWKQTSYNRAFRKNFAGVGMSYDTIRDAFIFPKCHDEATLNENTCTWDCSNTEHTII